MFNMLAKLHIIH